MKASVIGSAMIDTIAIVDSDRIEKMSMANAASAFLLLEAGRKIDAREVSTHTGGGAVNVSLALSRLGASVTIVVKLGRDQRGSAIVDHLEKSGVNTSVLVSTDEQPTGASVMIASHDKDATIFTYRGANVLLNSSEIAPSTLAADIVYVAPLSDNSADTYPYIVETANAAGAYLAVNPGIRQISARGQTFRNTLPCVDVLILNRKEAEGLLPLLIAEFGDQGACGPQSNGEALPRLLVSGLSGGGYDLSLAGFTKAVLDCGTKAVAITDSSQGSYVATSDALWFCPSLTRTVAGTAGAGDAFGATLAYEIKAGATIEDALRFATVNASSVVAHVDTQTGLLTRADLTAEVVKYANELRVRKWQPAT